MKEYDFRALNDKEFERLSIDLLSQREGIFIERYKPGRDGGIDGYFHSSGKVIIQAKHYVNTGYSGLLSKLRNDELHKVIKLKPARYILVTSVGLTPTNKKEIMDLFSPFIVNSNDIIGQEGLNDLITAYPDIERNHYKLWLSSTNILMELLNNSALQKRNQLIKEAVDESRLFIETHQLYETLKILEHNNVVIITGLPGVGKTTLAKQVTLMYHKNKYDIYHIEDSIKDIESVYLREKKQFFYFDDFLGSNHLEIFSGDSDSKIVNFIKRIISDKNKKMILTSRTNILNRAKNISEIFSIEKIEKKEFEINVSILSDMEKADILYNHIWHSSLPIDYSEAFYKDMNYWKIIRHKNFNPRLISFITDIDRLSGIDSDNYWSYIENSLNNPKAIWSHCFNNQTPEEVLDIVCLVVFGSNFINESDCIEALKRVFKIKYPTNYYSKINKISSYIKESLKSTINRTILSAKPSPVIKLSPFNPSVADYIIHRFQNDEIGLILYFKALKTKLSINNLFSLKSNEKITKEIFFSIISEILEEEKTKPLTEYSVHFYHKIIFSEPEYALKNKFVLPKLFTVINECQLAYSSELGECIYWAIRMEPELFSEKYIISFLNYSIRSNWKHTLDHEDYLPLTQIIELYPNIKNEEVYAIILESIKVFWHENFDEHLANSGRIQYLDSYETREAENIAFGMLRDLISEYNLPFKEEDLEYMFENADPSSHIGGNYDHENDDDHSFTSEKIERENSEDYINDLFRRR